MVEHNGSVVVDDDAEAARRQKSRKSNKILLGVLSVLIVAAVGLTVGIVVVMNQKKDGEVAVNPSGGQSDTSGDSDTGAESESGSVPGAQGAGATEQSLSNVPPEVQNEIDLANQINLGLLPFNTEDSQVYLDEKMTEYAETPRMSFRITLMKAWVYVNADEAYNGLEVVADVDESSLDDRQKMDYYELLSTIYERLGRDNDATNYRTKWKEKYKVVFGTDGETGEW